MSKARLHLILCSDDRGPEAGHRRRDRGFEPSVIDGGKQTIGEPAGNPWQALLEPFDLGFLVWQAGCFAFIAASLAALEPQSWANAERADWARRRTRVMR